MNELKITEGKVLEIINKYSDLIKISDEPIIRFNHGYFSTEYKPILVVNLQSEFNMSNFNKLNKLTLEIKPFKHKNQDTKKEENVFTFKFSSIFSDEGVMFLDIKRFKAIVEMIEELQQIDLFHLPEFLSFMSMKEHERFLQEEKEKLEKELRQKQEEIKEQLEKLRREKLGL